MLRISVSELETPAILVDLDRMERNLDRAAEYATAHNLALRPHVKTHKSPRIATEQLRRGAAGLTCATPHEAEVMQGVCDDLLVAYPMIGVARTRRLVRLPERTRIIVSLDSIRAVEEIATAAQQARRTIDIYVELDLGMHRVGTPNTAEALAVARAVARTPSLEFAGIAFYPGHVREPVAEQDARGLAETSDSTRQRHPRRSGAAGLSPAKAVSGGSTPTLWRTHELPGVTEFRPGTYVYNDRTTALLGACDAEDCALTVLATVVSTAVPNQAVIDAGSKSLGREPLDGAGTTKGFGSLLDHADVVVQRMSEEHGILDLARHGLAPRSWRAGACHPEPRVHRRSPPRSRLWSPGRSRGNELAD